MRLEFEATGQPVAFIGVNAVGAVADQNQLVQRTSFPLFQDLPEVNVFGLQGGNKDDFFVYDKQGRFFAYLPVTGSSGPTDLSTPGGYDNVKNAILAALRR